MKPKPLDPELLEQAIELLRPKGKARRVEAKSCIVHLIHAFKRRVKEENPDRALGDPERTRRSDANRSLKKISKTFESAAQVWEDRHSDVDWMLHRAGASWKHVIPDTHIPPPPPQNDPTEFDEFDEIVRDRAKAHVVNVVLRTLAAYARDAIDPSGGRPHNEPKRFLAAEALWLFKMFRPGKASSTAGSDFPAFVNNLYELATGTLDADLERAVKDAIRGAKLS